MITEKLDDSTITYDDSDDAKETLYAACLEWFKKQDVFSGESIMQSDDPRIEAPVFLSDVAEDIFKFKQKWNE